MEKIIKKITEMEASARNIVIEAQEKEKNLDKNIADELASYRDNCMNRARDQLSKATETENGRLEEKIIALEKSTKRTIDAMAEAGKRYRAEWIDSIFKDIVKPVK